jgi:hypothetical protein
LAAECLHAKNIWWRPSHAGAKTTAHTESCGPDIEIATAVLKVQTQLTVLTPHFDPWQQKVPPDSP